MMKDIILIHPGGEEISFNPIHAKALMAMPNNGGWQWKDQADNDSSSNEDKSHGAGNSGNKTDTKRAKK